MKNAAFCFYKCDLALNPGLYPETVVRTSTGSCKQAFFMCPDLKTRTALISRYVERAPRHQFPMKLAPFLSLSINSVLVMAQLYANI